jgi:hypothetical protein
MSYDSNLIRFFILAPILPQYFIVLIILRRKLYREVGWFTIYLLFNATTAIIGFYLYQHADHWHYFAAAWMQGAVLWTLAFMVLTETFRNLIAPYPVIAKTGVRLLFFAGLALLATALSSIQLGAAHSDELMKALLLLMRSIMLVQLGLVVVIFAFSSYLAINWKHHQFGIALGFGLLAAVILAEAAYVAEVGAVASWKILIIEQTSHLFVVVLWTIYFLRPEDRPPSCPPPNADSELKHWNEALSELLKR